jgi:hypothetical protein
MASNLTTITNKSKQTVPILVNAISIADANLSSDLDPARAEQTMIPAGSELEIETGRIDVGQLEQLQRLNMITFVSR